MAEKQQHEFQAETKKLLDLMIHSIYTNKEIFLRELISNASDALDKVHFAALTDEKILGDDKDLKIVLVPNKENKTLVISDNGIGMTKEELMENLGTIAKSGTKAFLEQLQKENKNEKELIGQFGVGFYSAFMVADKISVASKKAGEDKAYIWESTADGLYTIEETTKETRGTTITLYLKDEFTKGDEDFTERYKIQALVKKYSDYVRYPIEMEYITFEKPKDENGNILEEEKDIETKEIRTLNSMKPLWTKSKSEITEEEYSEFYQNLFHDWEKPMDTLHIKAEGALEYTALLFIPQNAPFNLYHNDYEAGLQLYSRHVFIMEKCKDLLPEYLRFVKGLVDSPDFSLNISRELLQQSRELKTIGKNLEKNILKKLTQMLNKNREQYEKFFNQYGKSLKIGIYSSMYSGNDVANKLKDLLLFSSSSSEKLITLKEYVENMKENQQHIYYATGKDRESIDNLPQMEMLKEKGIDVLYFLDNVDEFAIEVLQKYDEKSFKSISRGDLNLEDENSKSAKEETENIAKEKENMLAKIKEILKDKVSDVRLTSSLKSAPVCLVASEQGPSFAMEQVFMETKNPMFKAQRILELNPKHIIFSKIENFYKEDENSKSFKEYVELLYTQGLLQEGIMPENPSFVAKMIADLMSK